MWRSVITVLLAFALSGCGPMFESGYQGGQSRAITATALLRSSARYWPAATRKTSSPTATA